MKHACAAALIMLATSVSSHAAEPKGTPMTADQFASLVTGRMLTFSENGDAYGAEQYLINNRVRWAFKDGTCLEGIWFSHKKDICFAYEDGAAPECWQFYLEGDTLTALFENTQTYEATASDGPLECIAPDLGV